MLENYNKVNWGQGICFMECQQLEALLCHQKSVRKCNSHKTKNYNNTKLYLSVSFRKGGGGTPPPKNVEH